MFTGIVEAVGTVVSSRPATGGRRLRVDIGPLGERLGPGASIAVNGVCLTVAAISGRCVECDAITETLNRSNLGRLTGGEKVNLERSLQPGGRLDGHFVQGHVDATAVVTRRNVSEREWVLWFRPDAEVLPYIVPKGSVAVDGVSLTVAAVEGPEFSVALIPTTIERTTLVSRQVGDRVNIESDIIARTVIHHLHRWTKPSDGAEGDEHHVPDGGPLADGASVKGGLSLDSLREHGYL